MKYEISKGTLAVLPNEKFDSLVYEDDERYVVNQTPYEIMESSCLYFGSSYRGRKEGAKSILGAEYKVPIIIDDTDNIIVFPTTSPLSQDCVWISLKHLKTFKKVDSYHTKIIFNNGKEIIVPSSYRSIENQVSRATRLDYIIRTRKNS